MKNLIKRLRTSSYVHDIVMQSSGNTLAQALGVISIPILSRLYSPADFGTLNIFLHAVSFMTILITWRYEYLIVLPKEESASLSLFSFVVSLGLTVTVLTTPLLLSKSIYISGLIGNKALADWLVLAPLTALLTSLSVGVQQRVQRKKNYRHSGLSEVANKFGYFGSGVIGSLFLPNIIGLMAATAIGMMSKIAWLLAVLLCSKKEYLITTNYAQVWSVVREYARLSSSWVVSHLMLAITGGLPALFIMKAYGDETLGQFSLVVSTLYLPSSIIGNAIGQVYYQRAAYLHSHGEPFDLLWNETAKSLIIIGLPVFTIVACLAPFAYPFVFGSQWEAAGQYAVIISFSSAFAFITAPMDRTCLVVSAWWYSPIWHGLRAASTILVIWLAWVFQFAFDDFLIILTGQLMTMYSIDGWAGWFFSKKI